MDHLITNVDRVGKTFSISSTVTLDDNSVQSEEYPAVGLAGIHLVAERLESAACKEITDPRSPRPRHRAAQKFSQLPGSAFRGFQCDVAAKAFGHNDVGSAAADPI